MLHVRDEQLPALRLYDDYSKKETYLQVDDAGYKGNQES